MRSFDCITAFWLALASCSPAQDFTAAAKAALEKAAAASSLAVPGSDPAWRFLANELRHLQHGDLAAADLAKVNAEGTDPVVAITKYNDELKALGVDLLVMPVPPKAAIYPDKLAAGVSATMVPSLGGFLKKLEAAGVQTLDLQTEYLKARAAAPDQQLYCATDSHWSPAGAELAAKLVAAKFASRQDLVEHQQRDLIKLKAQHIEFHGDLLTDAEKSTLPKETLPLVRSGLAANPDGTEVRTIDSDAASPILVIGDSHCQVFRRGGAMHSTCGGFIDHLNVDLSVPVEEVSAQASGGDGPRIEIARRTVKEPDFWKKKKIVVWVFTARELTQGKWNPKIPAVVKR